MAVTLRPIANLKHNFVDDKVKTVSFLAPNNSIGRTAVRVFKHEGLVPTPPSLLFEVLVRAADLHIDILNFCSRPLFNVYFSVDEASNLRINILFEKVVVSHESDRVFEAFRAQLV